VPEDGDEAEVTASRGNLDEVYARKGVKGYEKAGAKQYSPKGMPAARLETKVTEALGAFEAPEIRLEKANPQTIAEMARTLENTAFSAAQTLQEGAESGIIDAEDWREADFLNERVKAKHEKHVAEYGLDSFEEYVQGARDLLAAPLSEDIEGFRNIDGGIYRYRRSTNDFVIGAQKENKALIITRFMPDEGLIYWERVVESELPRRV
jgi:hypothetical protein